MCTRTDLPQEIADHGWQNQSLHCHNGPADKHALPIIGCPTDIKTYTADPNDKQKYNVASEGCVPISVKSYTEITLPVLTL
jgi:hypothetical protein